MAHVETQKLLLTRRGVVFASAGSSAPLHDHARSVAIELADLGYALSERLRARLACVPLNELAKMRTWLFSVLAEHAGAHVKHEPLFRRFPDDVPSDTLALWWQRVLVHYLQGERQPCLSCSRVGTTHVLDPCAHVVCDHCFDGSNYSGCPICNIKANRASPFFQPSAERPLPKLAVRFKLLDLGDHVDREAKLLVTSLCERKQALAPADREALVIVTRDYGEDVLAMLPATIPVKENVALVFGTLLQQLPSDVVLHAARHHVKTATDVLRVIAAYSGADPALQGEVRWQTIQGVRREATVHRFKVATLRRPLRRMLLRLLDGFGEAQLCEDMLRHRSYWVWLGEFLHPHEFAAKLPNVAAAFKVMRRKDPAGVRAPKFRGFASRVELALRARDTAVALALLEQRPGDFARRFDHVLRTAADPSSVVAAFDRAAQSFATPVLLTLTSGLPLRQTPAKRRVYFPKGMIGIGVSSADARPALPLNPVERAVDATRSALLTRFGKKPRFLEAVIDEALANVVAPFNERTASPAAVALPRGSIVPVAAGKQVRLFLHWCEPEHGGQRTDVDLSVGFYSANWSYQGVCSYYQLKHGDIAKSSGDFTSAPFPNGASEFVDVDIDAALAADHRYAVMVVNAYSGLPFDRLERAFAGLMLRDELGGAHFDPRSVELKFTVRGSNGIFLPLVIDLRERQLHWLDTYCQGDLSMNNVATSNRSVKKVCPELIEYFASGARMSMLDLALLHAAARCDRVFIRGPAQTRLFQRNVGEAPLEFLRRLRARDGERKGSAMGSDPVFAALYRGDVTLPDGSAVYALFREQQTRTLAAGDLIS